MGPGSRLIRSLSTGEENLCDGGGVRPEVHRHQMKTILSPLFVVTLFLPVVAVAETSPPDSNQLLRDYQAAALRYQEAAKVYRALRREVRGDPVLNEKVFGSSRPTTGLRLGPVPVDGKGVWVRSVVAGSLAEQAGLRAGDVVLAVDGERLDDLSGARAVQTMTRAIGGADTGASLRIEYLRDGEINVADTRTETSAEIAQLRRAQTMQGDDGVSPSRPRAVRKRSSALDGGAVSHWSGLTFANMTPELGQYFGAEIGVLIVYRADKDLPLMEGDVILKIGPQTPTDASHAVKLLQGYDLEAPVAFQIWRHGRSFLVEFDFNPSSLPDVEMAQDSR